MTEEQAKTISELYEEKSIIYKDLSYLTSDLRMTYMTFQFFDNSLGSHELTLKTPPKLVGEFRQKVIEHLQNRIQEIDKQLSEM
jgi:hypothetical protein